MLSSDATLFDNSIGDSEVPIPDMGTYFAVEPHTTPVTSSSNVEYASNRHFICTQESCSGPGSKHVRVESHDHEEEAPERKQPKRGLPSETNSGSSEKRRRERLKQKMAALKEMLPNVPSAKTDQASLLDQTIKHIRDLQSQVQLSSLGLNPHQIPPIGGETGSSSAPGRLEFEPFYSLPQLLMEMPTLPPAYLDPQQVLRLNQPLIWAPSTQEMLLNQQTFADNLSARALPPTLGSGIIQSSVHPQPNLPVPPGGPGPSNFVLAPEDVQNQASFHEDPFLVIQQYPPS